jgi:hypothetical protein
VDVSSTKIEVFCPHCNEAAVLVFARAVEAVPVSVQPRFDRTIENPNLTK